MQNAGTDNVYRELFISTLPEVPALIFVFILSRSIGAYQSFALFFLGSAIMAIVVALAKVCFNAAHILVLTIVVMVEWAINGNDIRVVNSIFYCWRI